MSFVSNVYNWLTRKGYAEKYEYAGIYSISIGKQLVYIGKSDNMLRRIAQHYVGIRTESERKYRILAEAQRYGYSINFDVLYYAQQTQQADIEEEIGAKEGEFIRCYKPALNTQIPKADDWHNFDINRSAQTITLQELLKEQNPLIQS